MVSDTSLPAPGERPPRWWHAGIERLARCAEPVTARWFCLPAAAAVGAIPFLICVPFGSSAYWYVSGFLLCLVILSLAWRRRHGWAVACLFTAFLCHNLTVMGTTAVAPEAVASISPEFQDYLDRQILWITTAQDPEYELVNWLPAHGRLAAGVSVFGYTSLGAVVYMRGFYEVDLMNFYTTRLIQRSRNPWIALLWGWHPWSVLRGIGLLMLSYGALVLALGHVSGQRLMDGRGLLITGSIGLSFVLFDAGVKFICLPMAQNALFSNLLQGG